jgi:hypothetical protein
MEMPIRTLLPVLTHPDELPYLDERAATVDLVLGLGHGTSSYSGMNNSTREPGPPLASHRTSAVS